MKSIRIKSLRLTNFKGIREFSCNFDLSYNTISADNRVGKTTLLDAFLWLLFDKNSQYQSDFSVKTLDKDNNVINCIPHSVEAIFEIDGQEITLKKLYEEVWTKKRGAGVDYLSKHETTYFINRVNSGTVSEYQKFVRENFCDEEVFKLITNPLYFPTRHWSVQKKMLVEMAGGVDPRILFVGNSIMLDVNERIINSPIPDKYPQEIASKIKSIKEEREKNRVRIEENTSLIPQSDNWEEIESEINRINGLIEEKQASLNSLLESDRQELKRQQTAQNEIFRLKSELSTLLYNQEQEALKGYYKDLEAWQERSSKSIAALKRVKEIGEEIQKKKIQIEELTVKLEGSRAEYRKLDSQIFEVSENDLICPIINQRFCDEKLHAKQEELIALFNQNKAEKIKKNIETGTGIKSTIEGLKSSISELEVELMTYQDKDYSVPQKPEKTPFVATDTAEILNIKSLIAQYESEKLPRISKEVAENRAATEMELQILNEELVPLRKRLSKRDDIEKHLKRIEVIEKSDKELSQALTSLEEEQDNYVAFNKAYMQCVNEKVSIHFKYVKFKLFNQLLNGNLEDTCEILFDGVPYNDLNTERKFNAGLDIINAISSFYNVSAPVWIDNAEAVSEFIPINAQTILLTKTTGINQLTIK